MLPRKVFECLVKNCLNLSLVCIYGSAVYCHTWRLWRCSKKVWPASSKTFDTGWIKVSYFGSNFCEFLNSLKILNTTSLLMSLKNSLPFCIIKHRKRSLIKLNIMFWPKFALLEQLQIYSTDVLCCSKKLNIYPYIILRMCVTSFYNNGKISKVRVICQVGVQIVSL